VWTWTEYYKRPQRLPSRSKNPPKRFVQATRAYAHACYFTLFDASCVHTASTLAWNVESAMRNASWWIYLWSTASVSKFLSPGLQWVAFNWLGLLMLPVIVAGCIHTASIWAWNIQTAMHLGEGVFEVLHLSRTLAQIDLIALLGLGITKPSTFTETQVLKHEPEPN
jgi:hypothetical protein